jgi:hypothetical protein
MANPLESGSVSPPAPNPNAGESNALQQGAPAQAGPQQQPAPTHALTVAALRHYDAIKGELKTLLSNPSLGKSDIKSQVIDGVSKLVAERMMTPDNAVMELSKVPEDPLQQRKWVQQQMMQATQAEQSVVEQHRNTNVGSGDWATEAQQHNTNPDNHMQDIEALGAQYRG